MLRHLGDRWSLCGTYLVPYGFEDQYDHKLNKKRMERTDDERTRLPPLARLGLTQVAIIPVLERSQLPSAPLAREAVADLEVMLPAPPFKPAPERRRWTRS